MKVIRLAFAALSLFFGFGLLVLAFRYPEKASAFLILAGAFSANGLLHWNARSAS